MSTSRTLYWAIGLCCVGGVAGIASLVRGLSRQVYRVPYAEASAEFMRWCTYEPRVDPAAGQRYLAMFGDRYSWIDLGLGLVATALAGLLLVAILFRSRSDGSWLRTPSKRWHFMLAGCGVIVWTCCGAVYSIVQDFDRWQLPWCADSMIIGIFETLVGSVLLLIVCSTVGLLLTLRFGTLPVPLWQWDHARAGKSWIVSIFLVGTIALVAALMIQGASIPMSIANPAGLVAIYLLASTRAALVAPTPIDE